jgi:hypothetical protein
MRQDIDLIVDVLGSAAARVNDESLRLKRAVEQRNLIHKLAARGEPPVDHPRYRWVMEHTNLMALQFKEWADQYELENPGEAIGPLDMYDLADNVHSVLLDGLRECGIDPTKPIEVIDEEADKTEGDA